MYSHLYVFVWAKRCPFVDNITPICGQKMYIYVIYIQSQKFCTFFGQRSKNCIAELKKKLLELCTVV